MSNNVLSFPDEFEIVLVSENIFEKLLFSTKLFSAFDLVAIDRARLPIDQKWQRD